MPGIGSQETHPIAALQDIGEFGVMGKFRFQAGIALFIQIIVVNGDKRVQVPVLRTYNPFAVGEFYQFNLSSCIRQQNSLTAQFVSFSLSNLANIFYPPQFLQ